MLMSLLSLSLSLMMMMSPQDVLNVPTSLSALGVTTLPPTLVHPRMQGFTLLMFVNASATTTLSPSQYIYHGIFSCLSGPSCTNAVVAIQLSYNYSITFTYDTCVYKSVGQPPTQPYQWQHIGIVLSEAGMVTGNERRRRDERGRERERESEVEGEQRRNNREQHNVKYSSFPVVVLCLLPLGRSLLVTQST